MNNDNIVDIDGLDSAEVLAALYNASKTQGIASFFYTPEQMTIDEAREIMKTQKYFDYLFGRVMKLYLTSESKEIDVQLYNRDNGDGAAQNIILELRTRPGK